MFSLTFFASFLFIHSSYPFPIFHQNDISVIRFLLFSEFSSPFPSLHLFFLFPFSFLYHSPILSDPESDFYYFPKLSPPFASFHSFLQQFPLHFHSFPESTSSKMFSSTSLFSLLISFHPFFLFPFSFLYLTHSIYSFPKLTSSKIFSSTSLFS